MFIHPSVTWLIFYFFVEVARRHYVASRRSQHEQRESVIRPSFRYNHCDDWWWCWGLFYCDRTSVPASYPAREIFVSLLLLCRFSFLPFSSNFFLLRRSYCYDSKVVPRVSIFFFFFLVCDGYFYRLGGLSSTLPCSRGSFPLADRVTSSVIVLLSRRFHFARSGRIAADTFLRPPAAARFVYLAWTNAGILG